MTEAAEMRPVTAAAEEEVVVPLRQPTPSHGERARMSGTPWRGQAIAGLGSKAGPSNAIVQRKAYQRMSLLERETGMSAEEWAEFHRVQRERVFARWAA